MPYSIDPLTADSPSEEQGHPQIILSFADTVWSAFFFAYTAQILRRRHMVGPQPSSWAERSVLSPWAAFFCSILERSRSSI